MDIEILHDSIRFQLHGLSSSVEERRYGEVGLRLMNQLWGIANEAALATTGINHWVYFGEDRMLVGVELQDAGQPPLPDQLEPCNFELTRYAKHVHVGPYHELPRIWQTLFAELSARGEQVTMPSLEVYGHACEDESQATTTILIGLA